MTTEKSSPVVAPPHPTSAMPTRNPLPLSASQEAQVKDLYYARVRGFCAEEIRRLRPPPRVWKIFGTDAAEEAVFAACARGRTVSATWKCRQERGTMNKCMISHATQENQDAAREEWFKDRMEKRRLRLQQEKEKAGTEGRTL